ncbi:kinesin-like protein KIN-5D isoform X1 [Nicotiana sylvestris]|uniref:125 kDa kinesin-related protein-like isoform X1 n=1 Tax=Nicotiana sylvestris TaxID=4096 RepID=A0A1U7XBE6_NICSY|nr:PREDICTED: 125 kDa kinesin-related protein-like isoform X1 [Nicotiana sylvestris]XP_009786966.1 PREDICTED: 125 kDa kinesin-related protein-like isoform X1 [Nicotiana sylvestris]
METPKSNYQRRGSIPPFSMSQTLWSNEKSCRDSRSNDEKGVNVKVVLRCRPPNEDEMKVKGPSVISCNELKKEVTATLNTATKQLNKTSVFDKVCGPSSQQKDFYDHSVAPLVNEAVEGYTCTIFAYGQTGTGKTYTMEGEAIKEKNGEFHKNAGVIPRAVQQIFDILECQKAEYTMKVAYIEIYNEEITDLLSLDEESKSIEEKPRKPLALMEDGKGAVFIRGLEEVAVSTADEIYKILEKGSANKHTAETLLNKQSNRSHSIFSITLQVKECTPEGLELIKCGKLNLVDLAGSENILRSGAKEGRAREAGEINKSLLTLGRVINALVDHSGHVPYRDSKLTRLLRDSLGGKTKTCIIATVSPSIQCLEETLSTLEYANRAKQIKNRPEVNRKVTKSALITDLYVEMDRLKQELHATREKNGIYIPQDRYLSEEAAHKAIVERLKFTELDLESKNKKLRELQDLYDYQRQLTANLTEELERTQRELKEAEQAFNDLEAQNSRAKETVQEKDHLVFNLIKSEKAMTDKALELQAEVENAESEISTLFAKIEKSNNREERNKILVQNFRNRLTQQLESLKRNTAVSVTKQEQQLNVILEDTQSFLATKRRATDELKTQLQKLKDKYSSDIQNLAVSAQELNENSQLAFSEVNSEVSKHSSSFMDLFAKISADVNSILNGLQGNIRELEVKINAFVQKEQQNQTRRYQGIQLTSEVLLNFFKTLNSYISKLRLMDEKSQTINHQQLCTLEEKFEELAASEERQLIEKVAELMSASNTRKKKLVQTAVNGLRECSSIKTRNLNAEFSNIQGCTNSAYEEWTSYVESTQAQHIEDSTRLEFWKSSLAGHIECCLAKSKGVEDGWRNAQESLLRRQTRNVNSIDCIMKSAMESNGKTSTQFSSTVTSILEETAISKRNLLSAMEIETDAGLLKLDHNECEKIYSVIYPCVEDMKQMKDSHSSKVSEIAENAGKALTDEYKVDEPSCSTLRRKRVSVPSRESIKNLRTPLLEESLKSFQGNGIAKRANRM